MKVERNSVPGEFTLKGDHRNYITLKMPEHVTYHSGSTKQTGTVKINGNTTFYFSAPKTVTGTWNSGERTMGTQWKVVSIVYGCHSQDIGYGAFFEESASVEFTVKWLDLARVKVTKKDKNSKVNLSGAVFGIYSDSACKNLLVQCRPQTATVLLRWKFRKPRIRYIKRNFCSRRI